MDKQHRAELIEIDISRTDDWEVNKVKVAARAQAPTKASDFFTHAVVLNQLFHILTHGTRWAPNYPERTGLSREIHDELFPIGHFARLHFAESEEVIIQWYDHSLNFDATVDDRRANPDNPKIQYLEVTTLQDREDAKLLSKLATDKDVSIWGVHPHHEHQHKLDLLKIALASKGKKAYRNATALLVYTDEERLATFTFGASRQSVDKKASFTAVVEAMRPHLSGFSHVFVYSKKEIYCAITPGVV